MRAAAWRRQQGLSLLSVSVLVQAPSLCISKLLADKASTQWIETKGPNGTTRIAKVTCCPSERETLATQLRSLNVDFVIDADNQISVRLPQATMHQDANFKLNENAGPIPLQANQHAALSARIMAAADIHREGNELWLSLPATRVKHWSPMDRITLSHLLRTSQSPTGQVEWSFSVAPCEANRECSDEEARSKLSDACEETVQTWGRSHAGVETLVSLLPEGIANDLAILHFKDRAGWDQAFSNCRQMSESRYAVRTQHPIRLLVDLRHHLNNEAKLLQISFDRRTAMYELMIEAPVKLDYIPSVPLNARPSEAADALQIFCRAPFDESSHIEPLTIKYDFNANQTNALVQFLLLHGGRDAELPPKPSSNEVELPHYDVHTLLTELSDNSTVMMNGQCAEPYRLKKNPFPNNDFRKYVELHAWLKLKGFPPITSLLDLNWATAKPSAVDVLDSYLFITGADVDEQARAILDPLSRRKVGTAMPTRIPVLFLANLIASSIKREFTLVVVAVFRNAHGNFRLELQDRNRGVWRNLAARASRWYLQRSCAADYIKKALDLILRAPHYVVEDMDTYGTERIYLHEFDTGRVEVDLDKDLLTAVDIKRFMRLAKSNGAVKFSKDNVRGHCLLACQHLSVTDAILLVFISRMFEVPRVVGRAQGGDLLWSVSWPAAEPTTPHPFKLRFQPTSKPKGDTRLLEERWQQLIESDEWCSRLSKLDDDWVSFVLRICPLLWNCLSPDEQANAIWHQESCQADEPFTYSITLQTDGSKLALSSSPVLLLSMLLKSERGITVTGIKSMGRSLALKLEGEATPQQLHQVISDRYKQIQYNLTDARARVRHAVHIFFWLLAHYDQASDALTLYEI